MVVIASRFTRPRGRKESDGFVDGCSDKRYIADRRVPERRWFHGVYAMYNGSEGDPAYWEQEHAIRHFYVGWQVEGPEDAFELIQAYQESRVNLAFDKVRLIIVAQVCVAAGWLSQDDAWRICEEAKVQLQASFDSWESLARAVQEGRAFFCKKAGLNPASPKAVRTFCLAAWMLLGGI